jgi:hypothetical protein
MRDRLVLVRTDDMPRLDLTPRQSVPVLISGRTHPHSSTTRRIRRVSSRIRHLPHSPFALLPFEPDVRPALLPFRRLGLVLCTIKDQHIPHPRLGRDEVGVLGHVSRAVDLVLVVDGLLDADSGGGLRVRSELCGNVSQRIEWLREQGIVDKPVRHGDRTRLRKQMIGCGGVVKWSNGGDHPAPPRPTHLVAPRRTAPQPPSLPSPRATLAEPLPQSSSDPAPVPTCASRGSSDAQCNRHLLV